MTIGKNLRQLRAERGLTQEQVAERLHVSRQTLSSYESGRTRPDVETLVRLCGIYGTDLDGVVYGQTPVLREARRVRRTAAILLALLGTLTLCAGTLRWSANRFFPLAQGQVADAAAVRAHFRVAGAAELADGLLQAAALWGSVALLVLIQTSWRRLPLPHQLGYLAVSAGAMLALSAPFAALDLVFTWIDYLLPPFFALCRMLLVLISGLIISWVRDRRSTVPPEK